MSTAEWLSSKPVNHGIYKTNSSETGYFIVYLFRKKSVASLGNAATLQRV